MTDGRVNRGEEIGEPGIPKHLLLTIDRENRTFEAIGIEHDRRGSEFANAVCQLATDDEPRAHLSRGIIEVNRVHDPDRETRAQARQLTGEQVTIDGGFNGYQDLRLHTHWLPIIPTTTSAEKSTIPVHEYESAPRFRTLSHAAPRCCPTQSPELPGGCRRKRPVRPVFRS
jgi:hypothetical protein